MGLDLDLDEPRGTLAVGNIGLAAARAGARGLRRIAPLLLLAEPGPRGAAVARRAALLAAVAPRTLLRLLLALAPEQRLRQGAPGRLQSGYPGFQPRVASPQRLYLLALAGVRPAQRCELAVALPRASQRLTQPGVLPGQGIDFPAQRTERVLVGLACRRGLGRPDGSGIPRGFRRPQILAQPEDFHAHRRERAALARIDAGLRKQLLQSRHFRLVEQRVLRRAPDLLHLLDRRLELVPAPVEVPLQRTGPGTGGRLRHKQLFGARLRRVRPRPLLLRAGLRQVIQRPPVGRLAHRRRHGGRPQPVVALGPASGSPRNPRRASPSARR